MPDARRLAGAELAAALRNSRATTLSRVADLDDAAWAVAERQGVNPIAWELGHLAWFAEFWILRGPHRLGADGYVHAAKPPRMSGSDALYDSARFGHAARWRERWPARTAVLTTLAAQLEACIDAIPASVDDDALYFHRLALFHEDMHAEAFTWLRAAEGHCAPADLALLPLKGPRPTLSFDESTFSSGRASTTRGFSFDNEQPSHDVHLGAFEIDAVPVDNGAFVRFVEAGGYAEAALWPDEAGPWRAATRASHPARWRRGAGGDWQERWFDRWRPLDPARPVIHVNAWEAAAYARSVGRRLPSAAEWEHAAQSADMRWGHSVWEWTADPFLPYEGFAAGPYRDYSAPWFGSHRELRGGSFATHARLHDRRYRNFFSPERNDIFAGLRTASTFGANERHR